MELIKCIPMFLLIATTLAQYGYNEDSYEGYHHRPIVHHQVVEEEHGHDQNDYDLDYHAHPKYSFDYSVKDPHTGDNKEHWETRNGDKVKGSYTLLETDGTKRVVEYEADDKNGFNAVVHRIGIPHKVEVEHEEVKIARPVYESYPQEYQHLEEFVPVHEYEH